MLARTGKHSCDIHKVARECGIKLRDGREHSSTTKFPKNHCFCKATLRAIGQRHGEDHLRLVLRLLADAERPDFHSATIIALSKVILSGAIRITGETFDRLDSLDLTELRGWAAQLGLGSTADVMAVALVIDLADMDDMDED